MDAVIGIDVLFVGCIYCEEQDHDNCCRYGVYSNFPIFVFHAGYDYEPWTYRFIPFELSTVLLGTIAHRLYRSGFAPENKALWIFMSVFLIETFIFLPAKQILGLFGTSSVYFQWFYYLQLALVLPSIFNFTKSMKVDRMIGDLSYPIYLYHLLVIEVSSFSRTSRTTLSWSIFGWSRDCRTGDSVVDSFARVCRSANRENSIENAPMTRGLARAL